MMTETLAQDVAPDKEEKRPGGKFFYAVILSDKEREFGPIGLEGGRVYTIPYQDIAAVVSDYPVTEIKALRKNLLPYHLTIRRVAEECPTIPAKFGQVADDAGKLRRVLQANYDEIREGLARLEDKVEMGLKISWTVENVFEYVAGKSRELRVLRDRLLHCAASLTRKQQIDIGALAYDKLNEMREEITEKVITLMQDSVEEVEINQIAEEKMVMRGAFLVRKDHQNDFAAVAQKVADLLGEDYAVKVDGPWVPFSFVRHINLFEEGGTEEEKEEGVCGKAA